MYVRILIWSLDRHFNDIYANYSLENQYAVEQVDIGIHTKLMWQIIPTLLVELMTNLK